MRHPAQPKCHCRAEQFEYPRDAGYDTTACTTSETHNARTSAGWPVLAMPIARFLGIIPWPRDRQTAIYTDYACA